jgi:hypothetical protein
MALPEVIGTSQSTRVVLQEVASVMERARMNAVEAIDDNVVREFSDSFIGEISGEKPGGFLPVLSRVAWSLALAGGDTPGLLKAITVMRQLATAIFDGGIPGHIEEIFQKANMAIADSAARARLIAGSMLSGNRRC